MPKVVISTSYFGKYDSGPMDELKAKLLEINPKYEFSYEDGHVKNDILVAQPPKPDEG